MRMRDLWCVAILAVGLAQGQERQPGQGVNFYSKEKEIALGRQLAQEFRRNTAPLDNTAVADYVKRVGANLAAQLPGGWTYQIETVGQALSPTNPTHEPTAFPGGFIFVSVDLIPAARNEAEFAGMLAHAMAHVAERHGTRIATRTEIAQIGAQTAAAGVPDRWVGPTVPLGMRTLQRAFEREADSLAVKAMAAAGYDPAGLGSYVERLEPSSQPDRDQRVDALHAAIRQLPARTYQAGDEFARVQAEVASIRK